MFALRTTISSNTRAALTRTITTMGTRAYSLYSLDGATPELPESGDYWIAPNAAVMGHVKMGKDTSVWWNATLRGDNALITVGDGTNIQDGSVVHTDVNVPVTIGKNVTVGHLVMLHGCEIGDNSLIGIGSVILNNVKIGKNCIIGANTLISENKVIPDNSLVMGSPGKVVKQVTADQEVMLQKSAELYIANYKRFKQNLKPVEQK
eukprot:comp26612_c0_seq1/m.47109 comp26612_c0_seq1/g.47109  ORF comp26612_c0_seq1/g.47109 comp26612_c0_seq1/m.47109 type:complete len:206 (-) comp26612_c0_seq1:326-943(-)